MESHIAKRQNPIRLLNRLMDRCVDYGHQAVAGYAAGRNEASRGVSTHGAESDAPLWIHARKAECAFCIFMGLDPMKELHWDDVPDHGWDVRVGDYLYDVKAITPGKHFLVWPIGKRHIFESKKFTHLVLVCGGGSDFVIEGWVSKERFRSERIIAGRDHPLDEGSWCMHKSQLDKFVFGAEVESVSMPSVEEWEPIAPASVRATGHFAHSSPERDEAYKRGLIKLAREGQKPYWIRTPRNE